MTISIRFEAKHGELVDRLLELVGAERFRIDPQNCFHTLRQLGASRVGGEERRLVLATKLVHLDRLCGRAEYDLRFACGPQVFHPLRGPEHRHDEALAVQRVDTYRNVVGPSTGATPHPEQPEEVVAGTGDTKAAYERPGDGIDDAIEVAERSRVEAGHESRARRWRATISGWSHCGQCDAPVTTSMCACLKWEATWLATAGPR